MQGWSLGWGDGLILCSVAVGSWNLGQAQGPNPNQGKGWAPSVKLSKWDFLKTGLAYSKLTAYLSNLVSPLFQTASPKSSSMFQMWFYSSCFCEGFVPSCNKAAQILLDFFAEVSEALSLSALSMQHGWCWMSRDGTAANPTLGSETWGVTEITRGLNPSPRKKGLNKNTKVFLHPKYPLWETGQASIITCTPERCIQPWFNPLESRDKNTCVYVYIEKVELIKIQGSALSSGINFTSACKWRYFPKAQLAWFMLQNF